MLGWHNLSDDAQAKASIDAVEFTAVRTKHGTIPIRVFYPESGKEKKPKGEAGAIVYMHGGTFIAVIEDRTLIALEYRRIHCW